MDVVSGLGHSGAMAKREPDKDPELARAYLEWARRLPREARRMQEFDERRGRSDAAWNAKRRAEREPTGMEPPTKARQTVRQTTSVARGATTLLTPTEHYLHVGGALIYLGGTSSSKRLGPGQAAITVDGSIGDDERRAEFVWAAAILFFDFLAVYRELRTAAPTHASLDRLITAWPEDRTMAVAQELRARGASMGEVIEACGTLPIPYPPPELGKTLALVHHVGKGAHLLVADLASLDLDEDERELISGFPHSHRVRDLPERTRTRLFARREHQIHVRRVPALPQERGARASNFYGTALADLLFAGHCLVRRFSHTHGAPHRTIDVADGATLGILYREGPKKAAYAATATMLGRTPNVISRLVTQAKVLGLVVRENTVRAE